MRHLPFTIFAITLIGARASFAQETAAPIPEAKVRWEASIEPAAWFVGAGGSVKVPGSGSISPAKTTLTDLNMDGTQLTPAGELCLRRGDWGVQVRGFIFSTTNIATGTLSAPIGDVQISPSDSVETTLDFTAFEVEGTYRLWHADRAPLEKGGHNLHADVDLVFGGRLYDVELAVQRLTPGIGPSNDDVRETFIEPLVGAKLKLEINEQFDVDVLLSVGGLPLGDRSSLSVDAMAGFTWRPLENVGVQVGYRQLAFILEEGSGSEQFRYPGALAGLSFGVMFRF